MKTLFLALLVIVTLEASGQNHLVGLTGSINRTNIRSSNFQRFADPRLGISGGITYEYFLKKRFSVGTDVVYIRQGFRDNFETPVDQEGTYKFHYDYLSVPLKAGYTKFGMGNNLSGFAKAGLVPSFLISAETIMPVFNDNIEITGTETTDITSRVSSFDLAGLVEIGGGYKVIDRLWLTASFMYQHSFTSITTTEYFSNAEMRHHGLTFNLGLKWAMKQE